MLGPGYVSMRGSSEGISHGEVSINLEGSDLGESIGVESGTEGVYSYVISDGDGKIEGYTMGDSRAVTEGVASTGFSDGIFEMKFRAIQGYMRRVPYNQRYPWLQDLSRWAQMQWQWQHNQHALLPSDVVCGPGAC